jgi:hypothetical protein
VTGVPVLGSVSYSSSCNISAVISLRSNKSQTWSSSRVSGGRFLCSSFTCSALTSALQFFLVFPLSVATRQLFGRPPRLGCSSGKRIWLPPPGLGLAAGLPLAVESSCGSPRRPASDPRSFIADLRNFFPPASHQLGLGVAVGAAAVVLRSLALRMQDRPSPDPARRGESRHSVRRRIKATHKAAARRVLDSVAPGRDLRDSIRGRARATPASRTMRADPRVALRARGPAGPAATPPSFGCDHLDVPPSPFLRRCRSTAGGRRRALPAPRGGVSPFDHVPRLSPLSIRRAEPEPLPPGWARRATALGPLPRRPRRSSAAAAPLLVVADEHCLPQEGECLRSTTYPDCRRCPSAGLSRSRCPRAGPAGPLRWGRCPAALAVPPPPPLHCWWSSTSTACPKRGSVSVRPRTPTVVAVHPPG